MSTNEYTRVEHKDRTKLCRNKVGHEIRRVIMDFTKDELLTLCDNIIDTNKQTFIYYDDGELCIATYRGKRLTYFRAVPCKKSFYCAKLNPELGQDLRRIAPQISDISEIILTATGPSLLPPVGLSELTEFACEVESKWLLRAGHHLNLCGRKSLKIRKNLVWLQGERKGKTINYYTTPVNTFDHGMYYFSADLDLKTISSKTVIININWGWMIISNPLTDDILQWVKGTAFAYK